MINQNVIDNDLEGVKKDLAAGVLDLDNDGIAYLETAIKNQNFEMVKLFVNKNPDILIGDHLVEACKNDDVDIVKYILDMGVDPNSKNGLPLIKAVRKGKFENVKILLDYKADVHVRNDEAVEAAVWNGRLDITKILFLFGVDRHTNKDVLLNYAAKEGYLEIINYLLSFNDTDITKSMALELAAVENRIEVIKRLIDYGFVPYEKLMELAMFYDHLEMCKLLKEKGVEIEDDFVRSIKSERIKSWWFSDKHTLED